MFFFDTETCGFCGPCVLIQYAEDDGEIQLHSVWTSPFRETLELIDRMCASTICGFNLTFDWFQLCKIYGMFLKAKQEGVDMDELPSTLPASRTKIGDG
jgi:hypothetical protein